MIYLTSDLHFNHDREFIYKPRACESVHEMNGILITNFNEIVSDGSKNSTTKGREVFMFLDPTDYQSIDVVKAFSKSINSGNSS